MQGKLAMATYVQCRMANSVSSTIHPRPINLQPNDYTVVSIQWSLAASCVQHSIIHRAVLCAVSASNMLYCVYGGLKEHVVY